VSLLFSNPEFIRNARIQLRSRRLLAGGVISAVASITTWESVMHADIDFRFFGLRGGGAVFALCLGAQICIALIGGGICCLLSVQREKELNTFDYQRVTRLTSFELAIGKLFGAPIATYVGVLFLMPVALIAAAKGHIPALLVLEVYVLMLIGCVTYHAFALMISVLLGRSGTVLAILFFLAIVLLSAQRNLYIRWRIQSLSPFYVMDLLNGYAYRMMDRVGFPIWPDGFFDKHVAHWIVFSLIHVSLTTWFLIAVRRNLKRDPSIYEVYSPLQAFLFSLYLSVLMLGFFPWSTIFVRGTVQFVDVITAATPNSIEQSLLEAAVLLFGALGLTLLRSRERARQRVRELGERAAGWLAAIWPTPYLVAAVAALSGAVILLIGKYRDAGSEWNLHLALYEAVFLCVWLSRDTLYLQWMGVRRGKRTLVAAVLYLTIFYVSLGVLFGSLNLFNQPRGAAYTALLLPMPVFGMEPSLWSQAPRLWIGALFFQAASALIFAGLQRHRLQEFLGRPPARAAG